MSFQVLYDIISNKVSPSHKVAVQPPHEIFSEQYRVIFRNWHTWNVEDPEDPDWYTLPGHAKWWPDNYDFAENGFDISSSNIDEYKQAWDMVFAEKEPNDGSYNRIAPYELRILEDTFANRKIISKFQRLPAARDRREWKRLAKKRKGRKN